MAPFLEGICFNYEFRHFLLIIDDMTPFKSKKIELSIDTSTPHWFGRVAPVNDTKYESWCREILLAYQVGCRRLMIQSDCAEVVETIHQGGLSATASAPIYDECAQIWQDFISISIEHCNRETNCVADELARMAMASNLTCNWVDEPPRNILEALVNDVTMFQDK